jgi:hypothetical protein
MMIRSFLIASSLALTTAICVPNLGSAREPEVSRSNEHEESLDSRQPEGREEWREKLLLANQEFAIAVKRSTAALRAYRDMRQRRRPRGEAKQAIMDEVELSREELTRAQEDLKSLEQAARRAGAPSRWLKFEPAEIEAATQLPASQQP